MFVRLTNFVSLPPPFITLTTDGEITFLWKTPLISIDLGFFGDGTYSYFARSKDGNIFRGDGIAITASLPQEIVDMLSAAV